MQCDHCDAAVHYGTAFARMLTFQCLKFVTRCNAWIWTLCVFPTARLDLLIYVPVQGCRFAERLPLQILFLPFVPFDMIVLCELVYRWLLQEVAPVCTSRLLDASSSLDRTVSFNHCDGQCAQDFAIQQTT
ncbi:hypothetical protein BDY19DRAFT_930039 [Irpex rosettiformis]|uniref:Uncharacterized protein n=1 Tax=Irpex rosettiformis TaxID=378272 RepID=A0ACB8UDH4_9APHY|nr:hypothetical protein BDY19DRAFT_930039 [Irpex rosettiformis]